MFNFNELAFNVGQKVRFMNHPDLKSGTVSGIYIDSRGATFSVEYLDTQGVVHRTYFDAVELTAA
jgi:hypothetical protein